MTITGKYVEGDKAYLAVTDVNVSSSDVNGASDQLASALGPLVVTAPGSAHYDVSSGNHWYYSMPGSAPYWDRSGSHAQALHMPLGTIRSGQKITAVSTVIYGEAVSGGTIILYKQKIDTVPTAIASLGNVGANPWNAGSAWVTRTVSLSGGSYTAEDWQRLFLAYITPASGTARVLGAYYTIQFGN
jgi:hypothetical protein